MYVLSKYATKHIDYLKWHNWSSKACLYSVKLEKIGSQLILAVCMWINQILNARIELLSLSTFPNQIASIKMNLEVPTNQ